MSIVKHKRGSSPEVSARRDAELKALAEKPEAEIDYSDIPATDDKQWSGAVRGKFYRPLKTQASVRIDADVMEWLKRPGKGYQTRLNAILREAMLRDQNKNRPRAALGCPLFQLISSSSRHSTHPPNPISTTPAARSISHSERLSLCCTAGSPISDTSARSHTSTTITIQTPQVAC